MLRRCLYTAVLIPCCSPAGADAVIDEWPVPIRMDGDLVLTDDFPRSNREQTRPRDPFVDSYGRVWFCGQAGNYVAYLEPETGSFRRYELPTGTHPHNLIIDEDDQIWYAGNRNGHIGKLDSDSGEIERFVLPAAVRDPHTLVFDQDGNIWFTAQFSNVVGRLNVVSGKTDVVDVGVPRARPYGIVIDREETLWMALFGTNAIAKVDPVSMEVTRFELPQSQARPRRIAVTDDGAVWYVDYSLGRLGKLDPKSGDIKEFSAPSGPGALPYALASDDRGRLWFVESPDGASRLIGFDPDKELFFSMTALPSGGKTVRHMVFDKRSGDLWFGADSNTIGRAGLP